MKKPKLQNNPLSWVETKQVEMRGVRLSDIQFVSPAKLKENPLNTDFFREESADYFAKLRADVEQRGIIVPLVVKKDDTLLAGHNRLRVARELGIENVPVQYVLEGLSATSEREFIIKDNLYRRHFSGAEWIDLYRKMYPDFDEQITQETRGGGRKWNKTENSVLLKPASGNASAATRLTAEKIASDTGQKLSAVQKQLTKYKREKQANSPVSSKQRTKTAESSKKTASRSSSLVAQLSASESAAVLKECSETLKNIEARMRSASPKAIKQFLQRSASMTAKLNAVVEQQTT
jgi:ParB-like chromosome segregation protein Spo0J